MPLVQPFSTFIGFDGRIHDKRFAVSMVVSASIFGIYEVFKIFSISNINVLAISSQLGGGPIVAVVFLGQVIKIIVSEWKCSNSMKRWRLLVPILSPL